MFALSTTVYEIFGVEICTTLNLTLRIGQGQIRIHKSKVNRRLPIYWQYQYLSYVTVYEILTVIICMTLSFTFRISEGLL